MAHKRNTSGLKSNAGKKKKEALKKTDEAIKRLIKKKEVINFNTVAEEAGVSKAWLYKESDIAERIKRIRDQSSDKKAVAVKASTKRSDSSKDALISTLKAKVRELETENSELKKQLEVVYGKFRNSSM
ncbi:DUF6262 family protein [Candidatus Enterovibrio altilux]|uniref:Mobile element protein n=1 Tax=Candidatus Enterovibrio altilux TaxID=1927128 RepID=A0A291BB57_9GAMM|nr:DUF6262 family protein [Candidatus Enterovibrio luxaltus]ATF10211.1 Mobile element protein [Candidatus Enterovibrio luxaltus]